MGAYLTPPPLPPIDSSLDIEIEGVENEPPPLGTNDVETGPPEPEPTPPPPEPEPAPPEPEPEPELEPAPVVQPDFVVPEETPTPAPKPKATPKPAAPAKPKATPGKESSNAVVNPNARPGAIKGVDASRGGVAGGRGAVKSSGGKADFVSRPNFQVPNALKARLRGARVGFSGSITYSGGRITSVDLNSSSGVGPLDSAIKRHVMSTWRVKAGSSGRATLPIAIRL